MHRSIVAVLLAALLMALVGCECDQLRYYPVEPDQINITFFTACELIDTQGTETAPDHLRRYQALGQTILHTYSCDQGTFTVPFQERDDKMYVARERFGAGCSNEPIVQSPEHFGEYYETTISRAIFTAAADNQTFCENWFTLLENATYGSLDAETHRLTDLCLETAITEYALEEWVSRCELSAYTNTSCKDYVEYRTATSP